MSRLIFPNYYFRDEIREDFKIESMVKRAWGAQLEILNRISEICDKYNLQYFAIWGTLLGAVRHNGYIPWDDDLDIAMKRDDYEKFLEVAEAELPKSYVVISPYTEPEWGEQLSRVTNTHSINFSDEFLDEYHGFPFVAGVDIFPYDYMPDDEDKLKELDSLMDMTVEARNLVLEKKKNIEVGNAFYEDERLGKILNRLETIFGFNFDRETFLENQLLCLFDQIAASYRDKDSKFMTHYANRNLGISTGRKYRIPTYCFDETIDALFEGFSIKIPKYYELVLTKCYGMNYMQPRRGAAGHDYPFFNGQIDVLNELGRYDEVMEAVGKADERACKGDNLPYLFENVKQDEDNCVPCDIINTINESSTKNSKKTIMCCISTMNYYEHEEECLNKLESVLDTFKKNADNVDLILVNAPLVDEVLFRKDEHLAREYYTILNKYISDDFGRFIEYDEVMNVFSECDAYYGSYNECVKLFTDSKKPVMIVNTGV